MKRLGAVLVMLICVNAIFATDISGSLSGIYGAGIYHVTDTISVESGNSVQLMPGTTFMFDGSYPFEIYGTLLAEGTKTDSIIFTTDTLTNPNRWRGLRFLNSSSAGSRLSYCLIENGYATGEATESKHGGGVYCHETWPAFEHCTFRNNGATWGGGVSCRYYSPTFESCVFQNNTSTTFGGGMYGWYSSASFTNCIFIDNIAQFGGGAYCSGSTSTFTHCTFFSNTGSVTCGGVYCGYSQPIVRSSIIAFSSGTGIQFTSASSSTIEYCSLFGNSSGNFGFSSGDSSQGPLNIGQISTTNANGDSSDIYMNIFFNPLFADTAAMDFHLNEDSPCAAAGKLGGPNEDFDGNIRPDPPYTPPDIGAFENEWGETSVWLRNDNGVSGGYLLVDAGFIWATKLYPSNTEFQVDSIRFSMYRPSTGVTTPTLTFRIHLYEDDGTLTTYGYQGKEIECEAPLTVKWSSAILETTPMNQSTMYWFTYDVADCVMTGNFIVGIEIMQENAPSLFVDSQDGTVCCTNYYYDFGLWFEHWSFFLYPETVGYNHIRAFGHNLGERVPSELQLSAEDIWFGYSNIHWPGDSEILEDSIQIVNVSGVNNTIEDITFTNPAYFWSDDEDYFDLPWNFGPLESRWLTIRCTTDVPEPTLTEGDIIITHSEGGGKTDSCHLSIQGFAGHWLENFAQYPDPVCGEWNVLQYDCATEDNPNWEIFANIGWANHSAIHSYSNYGCYAEDMLFSSPFANPNQTGIQVRWGNDNYYNPDYDFHGLYWTSPDDPDFHLVAEIQPNWTADWVNYGPYFIASTEDSLQLGFYYKGEFADAWLIDEIRVDTLPPLPPVIIHDHHSDDGPATFIDTIDNCSRITAEAFDPNDNFSYINFWFADETHNWTPATMTPVAGCEANHLYESIVCDLEIGHRYSYYFEAADDDPGTPMAMLPDDAPTTHFHIDIMDNSAEQIAYDNGEGAFLRYSFDWQGRFAVRFTPPAYPYNLGGVMVMIGNIFPDYNHEDIVLEVYDDDGADNLPGTLLYGPDESGTSWNLGEGACDDTTSASWIYIRIQPSLVILSGDFYISLRNASGSQRPDMESFAYDSDGPTPNRNYCFYPTEGGGGFWGIDTLDTYTGDIMIRALESPFAPPYGVTAYYEKATNHVVLRWIETGASSYTIYRSLTNPFDGFSVLGTVTSSPYNDTLTLTKSFYNVTASYGQFLAFTHDKPSKTSPSNHSLLPIQIINGNRTATLLLNQPWPLVEEQFGALPKTVRKNQAAHFNRAENKTIIPKNTPYPSIPRKIKRLH